LGLASDGIRRTARGFKAIPCSIPEGCAAAYFPEANVLVPINSVADKAIHQHRNLLKLKLNGRSLSNAGGMYSASGVKYTQAGRKMG
jgi:hypothetical protein